MHPFDDPDVVAGQGSLGLELLEDVPDLAQVVVPVGGGGLASGVAIAVKSARPEVEVVGVQVAACAPYPESLRRGEPVPATSALTIADGIAVKRPGELTLPLLESGSTTSSCVGEDEIAEAMVLLMERAKLVVEGAGAVGVAALLGGQVAPRAEGTTVAVLSRRQRRRRAARLDRPPPRDRGRPPARAAHPRARPARASSARLLALRRRRRAPTSSTSSHVREGVDLHVRETGGRAGARDARRTTHAERGARRARATPATEPRPCTDCTLPAVGT